MTQNDSSAASEPGEINQTTVERPDMDTGHVSIVTVASRPDVDPCDVLCDALPALSCGDLSLPEQEWIDRHTAHCNYCANELKSYTHLCQALDQVYKSIAVGPCPAPRFLPARPTAWYRVVESPVGPLFVAATDEALVEIAFSKGRSEDELRRQVLERGFTVRPFAERPDSGSAAGHRVIDAAVAQLREYFGGQRDTFDVPLDLSGLPSFTRDVLNATVNVPFGQLDTYRGIATQIGKPGATRAVGNALNRNPIPVMVPCHRIIRSDGTVGGYGGGLDIKFRLLALEGIKLAGMSG